MDFNEFQKNVKVWAEVRNIYTESTEAKQQAKALEELGELLVAIDENDIEEIKDGIGDVTACIINAHIMSHRYELFSIVGASYIPDLGGIAATICSRAYYMTLVELKGLAINRYNLTFEECLDKAWNDIKNRKGMMVDGFYVKYGDLTTKQQIEIDRADKEGG